MRLYLFALLLAAGSLAAQTNVPSSAPATNAAAPPATATPRPSATVHLDTSATVQAGASLDSPAPVATGAPRTAVLKKLQRQAAEDQSVSAGVNELGDHLSQLEPTGQFVERYVRIPAGTAGEDPKVIRFYIPVYRMRAAH
jgi:hypothetical protein